MGVILSKFRRKKPSLEDSLEKIDKELHDIRRFQVDTQLQQKQIIGRLSIGAFALYALGILFYYLFIHTESFTWVQYSLSLLPFIIFPVIIWSLRRFFGWWYERKIGQNKTKADSLRKEKERLLDEVMDTETFKVAKKILEKYAPSHLLPKYLADQQSASARGSPASSTPLTRGGQDLRRRTMGGPSVSPGMMGNPLGMGRGAPRPGFGQYRPQQPFAMNRPMRPGFPPMGQQPLAIMGGPGTPGFRGGQRPGMSSVPTGFTPMRYMLPTAPSAPVIHNRKAGWFDKVVDYVVGDGPTHRFALICRYCATHNGLATPEDFPYTGYRCIYCRQFNPPRQQRPSAATLPRNTVLIEELGRSGAESGGEEESSTRVTENNEDQEPRVELGDSTASDEAGGGDPGKSEEDEETLSPTEISEADQEGERAEEVEDIPFADEDEEQLEQEVVGGDADKSVEVEQVQVEELKEVEDSQSQDQNEVEVSGSSVVGKLEVNIHS